MPVGKRGAPRATGQVPAGLRRLAHILDTAIPLPGGVRIGLDGLIGLIPGVGDFIGTLFSSYIVAAAYRLGASRAVLAHMAGNIALESVLGAVPVLGDLFDFAWKANRRNIELLERYIAQPAQTRAHSTLIVVSIVTGLLVLAAAVTVVALALLRWLLAALGN